MYQNKGWEGTRIFHCKNIGKVNARRGRKWFKAKKCLHRKSGNWKKQPKCNTLKTYNSSSIQENRFLNDCVMGLVGVTLEPQSATWTLEWDSKVQCLKVQSMDPVIRIYLYSYAPKFLSTTQTAKLIRAAHVCRGWGTGFVYESNETMKVFQPLNPTIECLHKEEMGFVSATYANVAHKRFTWQWQKS